MLTSYTSSMGADNMQCLSSLNTNWHKSVHTNNSFLCVKLCNGSTMALKVCINLWKYCTTPKYNCIYLIVVGTGHSFKLSTFESDVHAFRHDIKAVEHCFIG